MAFGRRPDHPEAKTPSADDSLVGAANDLLGLIGNIPEALYRARADGQFVFVSSAMEGLLGYRPDELVGQKTEILYADPKDRAAFIEAVTAPSGMLSQYEIAARHKDGHIVHIAISARALYDRKGAFLGTEGSVRNITEDLETRQTMERAERRYRQLLEGLTDGVLIIRDGTIRYGNSAALGVLGLDDDTGEDEANGELDCSFLGFFPEERRPFIRAWLAQVQNTPEMRQRTFVLRDEPLKGPAGIIPVNISAHPMNDPEGNGSVQLVIHDLSEAKREEALLRLSERVFQSTPDMVAIVGADFRYRLANEAFCRFNGLVGEQVRETDVADLVSRETFEHVIKPRMNLCLGGQSIHFEAWFESGNRGRRYMEVTYTPMESRRGVLDGLIVVSRDTTERKMAEVSLQESESRARQLNDELEARVEEKTRDLVQTQDRLRTTIEASSAIIYTLKMTDGHVCPEWISDNMGRMLGYSPDECIGNPSWWLDGLHPADRRATLKGVSSLMKTGSLTHQYRFRHANGTYHWVQDELKVIGENESGKTIVGAWMLIDDAKEAESQLRDSEERFRAIAETSPTAVTLSEPESGRILFANPAACNMFGYLKKEMATLSAPDIYVDKTDRSLMINEIRRTGATYRGDERYRCSDGTIFWGAKSAQMVVMDGREILVSVISDVTSMKEATQALKRSEGRFRDIVETASDWFWETGPDHRLTMVPPQVFEATGIRREHFIGKTRLEAAGVNLDTLRGEEREKWRAHMDDLDNRRPFKNFEYTISLPDHEDRIFQISGRPFFNADGVFLGYRGSSRDASDFYKDQNTLLKLTRALEKSPLMVFITDHEGVIEHINPAFTEITGYTADEALGKTPQILRAKNTPPEVYADLWKTILSEKNWQGELEDRRKDGTHFWAHVIITPVRNHHGRVSHFVAMHEDITERKEAELKLLSARDQAELATRAKSEFLSTMSHELRTPLNAIIGFSELMKSAMFGPLGNKAYEQYAHDIHESGSHLLEIINDILDISAIESGNMELHESALDMGRIFASVRKMSGPRAQKKSIQIEMSNQANTPALFADERRVKQMLLNLVSNAVKFTPDGGQVWLEGGVGDDGGIQVRVRDTGIGMSAVGIKKALTRFGQVDSSLARRYEGAGLGLPLTKELAELHGGTIDIESVPGEGTTVTILFPSERTVKA